MIDPHNSGLRECPFCGSAADLDYLDCNEEFGNIMCAVCGAIGPTGRGEQQAITLWEHRGYDGQENGRLNLSKGSSAGRD